ncbi:MAG TPA: lysylphosphatidylglycerol synthase transmembrane domain-containing protein [Chitinophagales bacterium]|nr:lysylphosphatidylglycerol synthase transmembrane domain-containing protein [Chitinophagales bacterium]
MKQKIFSAVRILLFAAIGGFLFWLVIRNQNLEEIKLKLESANWWWAVLALVFGFFSNVFRSLRWNMLIHPLGYRPKVKNTFGALMVGYLANLAIPRLGEVTRSAILSNYEKIPVNKMFGTVVVERVIDVLTIFLLLFFVLLMEFEKMSSMASDYVFAPMVAKVGFLFSQGIVFYVLVIGGFAALLFASWFFMVRLRRTKYYLKLKDMLRGFLDGLKTIGSLKNRNLFLLYTVLIWLMYFLMSYVCFYSFPATSSLGWMAALAVMVFGAFGWAAPVQGGFGTFHVIVTQALFLYGIANNDGLAFAILNHATQVFGMLVFGGLALILLPIINRKPVAP